MHTSIVILIILSLKTQKIFSNIFTLNFNTEINQTGDKSFYIGTYSYLKLFKCLSKCNQVKKCTYASFMSNKCTLYTYFAEYLKIYSNESYLYKKKVLISPSGLINYWPIFNSNVNDLINKCDLFNPVNANFTTDRFGIPNSAFRLTNGYYSIPPGVYFDGSDFTINGWFKVKEFNFWSRFIDFGNGRDSDNVIISFSQEDTCKPVFTIRSLANFIEMVSNQTLILNTWNFLSAVYKNYFVYIYINATLKCSGISYKPRNVTRTQNYIGRSNWYPSDKDASAEYDDIKIYNRALNEDEIMDEYLSTN